MDAHGWQDAIVVTSDYHLQRALWLARDVGIEACGVAAESPHTPGMWLKGPPARGMQLVRVRPQKSGSLLISARQSIALCRAISVFPIAMGSGKRAGLPRMCAIGTHSFLHFSRKNVTFSALRAYCQ